MPIDDQIQNVLIEEEHRNVELMYRNKPNMNLYKLREVNGLYPINDLRYMHQNHPRR